MRLAAAILAVAAAGMAVAAFAAGGEGERPAQPAPPPAAVAARDGLAVWVEQGCGSCHTFAPARAVGEIGPDLAASLEGMPAAYVRESIVAPGAVAAPGFTSGLMPDDYAQRIAPADLDALVEFIRSGARD